MGKLPLAAASALLHVAEAEGVALENELGFELTGPYVAALPEHAAVSIGLPPNAPLALDIRARGVLGKPGCELDLRWLQPGKTIPARGASVSGPWLDWEGRRFRIPFAIYDTLRAAHCFNALRDSGNETLDQQFKAWADIRAALGEESANQLTDHYLRSFRVVVPSTFTLTIVEDGKGGLQLNPVLLRDEPGVDPGSSRSVRALTEADEDTMVRRLDEIRAGAQAFPLGSGTYVVLEEPLREALAKVRELRRAPADERKRAAMAPEAIIRELLGKEDGAAIPFVETESYAARVLDIREWEPPIVPWIKIPPQDWAPPVAAGVRIAGKEIPLDLDQVVDLKRAVEQALEERRPTAKAGEVELRATNQNLRALASLEKALRKRLTGGSVADEADTEQSSVLIIETNFESAGFDCTRVASRPGRTGWPAGVQNRPKPHQEVGLRWLQAHWIYGSTGAMLCDDMGLGKTFQALVFAKWLREQMESGLIPLRPIMVVAPVGLLVNWEKEHAAHLMSPGIGDVLRVYGEHVRAVRRGSHRQGTASLDSARIGAAGLVLANYEAVNEYQLSFGAIHFGAVILDEAQKIKSPATRVTHAVKGLKADFLLAMTGTPVENRLADLWCIADAVQPFSLKDLKSFSAQFETEDADVRPLRDSIWQGEADDFTRPKILLRRMKSDKLEGLPPKHEHEVRLPMPERQQEVYERAVALHAGAGGEATLELIHSLRRSSLHPALAEGGLAVEEELRIEDSARMQAMIQVLDAVYQAGEKALIFLESLDLQDSSQLPLLLQRRYKLSRSPMVINGQVNTADRQERVDVFQTETGFDVMLLSPRAGGVGLTLTAANHVIHLSRWWNPAVEDQCSDRVYRIGQTKPVHIYYPLAVLPGEEDSSFDVKLQVLMDRKRHLARNLLAAPAFTKKDYAELLQSMRQ